MRKLVFLAIILVATGVRAQDGISFLRGDANLDLEVNLTDAVYILNNLFLGGAPLPCAEAAAARSIIIVPKRAIRIPSSLRTRFYYCSTSASPFSNRCRRDSSAVEDVVAVSGVSAGEQPPSSTNATSATIN